MRLHHLFTHEELFYTHMRVLAVVRVITTCTFMDSPQLDQVMCAATYQCLIISAGYNCYSQRL